MSSTNLQNLRAAGEALYGAEWQSRLARNLGVDGRTMRFWASGARLVPVIVTLKLPSIMRAAAHDRHQAADELEVAAGRIADDLDAAAGRLADDLATRIEGKLRTGQRVT
jgi:hypothetical protein